MILALELDITFKKKSKNECDFLYLVASTKIYPYCIHMQILHLYGS